MDLNFPEEMIHDRKYQYHQVQQCKDPVDEPINARGEISTQGEGRSQGNHDQEGNKPADDFVREKTEGDSAFA